MWSQRLKFAILLFFSFFLYFFVSIYFTKTRATFNCDTACSPLSGVDCQNGYGCLITGGGSYYNVASCDKFDHSTGGTNYFKRYYCRIRKAGIAGACNSPGWAYSHTWSQTGSANTNVFQSACKDLVCTGVPAGCEQGVQPVGGSPTPTPMGGGPTPTGSCPYPTPINCSIVPCTQKNACGCSCTNPPCSAAECSGGGGPAPTATPTPTPTPFCRLFCPGQEAFLGQVGQNGTGLGNIDIQPTAVLPTYATGFLRYFGYNNFVCGTFDDAKTYVRACPVGSPGGGNLGDTWVYPTPTTNPLRYNMLCGGQPHTYTGIATAGNRSDSYGTGEQGGPTPTTGPTPKAGIYPLGCILGSPTPTPPGGIPRVGDQDAGFLRDQGGQIQSSSDSCACTVKVGCQAALEAPPSQTGSGCTAGCDFVVDPDNPVYNESTAFNLTTSGTTSLDFDDNTTPLSNPAASVNHTFANAGVYKVALSCNAGATVCKRDVNVYCSYIPKLWYKLKDVSFNKRGELKNPLPTQIIAYDSDDTTERYQVISQSGIVTTDGTITIGSDPASSRDWKLANYATQTRITPQTYIEYIKARKQYVTVTASGTITGSNLTKDKINLATGNFTLDSASLQSKSPFVLVINGDATITGNINPPAKSLAIIATGQLKITSAVTELNGIFIANSVDFASDITAGNTTNVTLKVVGNIAAQNAADVNKRKGDNIQRPTYFIFKKPEMYIDLGPLLSVRQYEWTQLSP